ncbi:transporter substrate-binding domain-containing protein [Chromobacterium vaccinii]|uniref:substrate-binding periplasmic protein n=1 Tax=Chromobacterium vaccinii TaxID=1108595 RepID=UPI000617DBE6|nr:transporter substrate-binding domain-containing protein [Chromobacterium vaccinii]MCD4484236.1 transporter substrate-binding domain-containing protein [Chromobacterium vaccinii]MCD4499995.1 transporter substrate-binding domain-containing protein [Chromobacterium vaccinii]
MRSMLALMAACWFGCAPAAELHAYTEDVPPLNYLDNGSVKGYSTEVLQLVAREAGLNLTIEVLPWLRAYAKARDTAGGLLYTVVRTPEREAQFQWVGPIGSRRIYMYRLDKRGDIRVDAASDLVRYRNGVLAGSASANQLQALGLQSGQNLDLGQSDAVNLKKLLLKRVDLVAMLDWAMAWQMRQQRLPEKNVSPAWLLDGKLQYWFALNPQTPPEQTARLQAALERVRADGRLQAIRRRYRDD